MVQLIYYIYDLNPVEKVYLIEIEYIINKKYEIKRIINSTLNNKWTKEYILHLKIDPTINYYPMVKLTALLTKNWKRVPEYRGNHQESHLYQQSKDPNEK